MRLGHPVRLLGVLVIACAAFLIAFEPIVFPRGLATPKFQAPALHLNLGLDLRGGSHIVLQARPTKDTPTITNEAMDGVLRVIRNRIDQLGVAEPVITRQGRDRIVAELPGIENPQRAIDLIGKTALLEFIDTGMQSLPAGAEWKDDNTVVLPDNKTSMKVAKKVILTGADLIDARGQFNQYGQPEVAFTFKGSAAKKFEDYTTTHLRQYLTIVLDNRVISSPVINSPIPGGHGVIEGGFTLESARDLAVLLRGGALPIPVEVVENRTIGPLLGRDSIDRSLRAGDIAIVLVGLFMALYYGFGGILADLALGVYTLMLFAVLTLIGATLTLPGIAGFILSLGVAVDANVIIFEKVKEELRAGKTLRAAVGTGWSRAIVTILDSNATTLIGALVLLWLGTGPVRGFAVTLILGILTSIFTAILVTRVFVDLTLETSAAVWIQRLGVVGGQRRPAGATGGAGE